MMKIISILVLLGATLTAQANTVKPIYVVHVNLGNHQLAQNIESELKRTSQLGSNRPVIILRPNLDVAENPFAVSKWSHQLGLTRLNNEIHEENTPVFSKKSIAWFQSLEDQNIHPEVFIMNGHHLLGMGFQSDDTWETSFKNRQGGSIDLAHRSLYFPTLIKSQKTSAVVRRFFEGIKLVFIGGCEGLANFEPNENGISGRALQPSEIKQKVEAGQKDLMVGDVKKRTGLAYYKYDLIHTYSDEFTDIESRESCTDKENKLNCQVYDVNRILPDSGLWDGSHIYNMPYRMKQLFPKALGIFGFNTPSPLKPGYIWQATFNQARRATGFNNILLPLLSDEVSLETKKFIVQKTRISWTKNSFLLNKKWNGTVMRNRISGSITPAFPELDQNGIFAYETTDKAYAEAPKFAPYEIRAESEVSTASEEIRMNEDELAQISKVEITKDEAAFEAKIQEIANRPMVQPDDRPAHKTKVIEAPVVEPLKKELGNQIEQDADKHRLQMYYGG